MGSRVSGRNWAWRVHQHERPEDQESTFTGSAVAVEEWLLRPGLNVLYGASNTGKSFAVKTIDLMLGKLHDRFRKSKEREA